MRASRRDRGGNPTEFVAVQCPFCGESFETAVDPSAGSFRYVEDCQVCCQPIELTGEVDEDGALLGVTAGRDDGAFATGPAPARWHTAN